MEDFLGLSLLALGLFLASLALGSVAIPLPDVVQILLGGTPSKPAWQDIVLQFRPAPRAITAAAAGAALAISGLQLTGPIFAIPWGRAVGAGGECWR